MMYMITHCPACTLLNAQCRHSGFVTNVKDAGQNIEINLCFYEDDVLLASLPHTLEQCE